MFGFYKYTSGKDWRGVLRKAFALYKREGLQGICRVMSDIFTGDISYAKWIKQFDTLSQMDRQLIEKHILHFSYNPVISILMPVHNPPLQYLESAIQSVRNQLYPNWELCITDDASTFPEIRELLKKFMRSDTRIKVTFRSNNGHISAATNTSLQMAKGDFIALLDHDDELSTHALYHVAAALNKQPEAQLLYSDEDKIDSKGRRFSPYFKPDWNHDLLTSQNYINHLGVYRTSVARFIGGFRDGLEGAQDWDFALRFIETIKPTQIVHLPYVLYHWRSIPGSTAHAVTEKNYVIEAAVKAIRDSWTRKQASVSVSHISQGHFRTRHFIANHPLVSIVILTRNKLDLLKPCLEGLFCQTHYSSMEIVVVDHDSDEQDMLMYLEEVSNQGKIRLLQYSGPFNFSEINNWAVGQTRGEVICLLNNDIEPIAADWLEEMVSHSIRPEIGAVGAMLYYPDDTIQHAGIIFSNEAPHHIYAKLPRGWGGYLNRGLLVQNLCAVTAACLVMRREVWEEVGGMDEANFPVAYNDVDLCLRIMQKGYRNLWTPFAELYHHESATRGPEDTPEKKQRFAKEMAALHKRWAKLLIHDPAWNPNLGFNGYRVYLSYPPRIRKPWLDDAQ